MPVSELLDRPWMAASTTCEFDGSMTMSDAFFADPVDSTCVQVDPLSVERHSPRVVVAAKIVVVVVDPAVVGLMTSFSTSGAGKTVLSATSAQLVPPSIDRNMPQPPDPTLKG